MQMTKTAGFAFEVLQPDGTWVVLVPQLFKTFKGAENSAKRFVAECAEEDWTTKARVIAVPSL